MDIDAVFLPVAEELIDDVFPTPIKYLQTETLLTILPRVRRLRMLLSTASTPAFSRVGGTSQEASQKSMS